MPPTKGSFLGQLLKRVEELESSLAATREQLAVTAQILDEMTKPKRVPRKAAEAAEK